MPAMKQRTNPTIATPLLTAPPPSGLLAGTGAFFVSLDMTFTFLFSLLEVLPERSPGGLAPGGPQPVEIWTAPRAGAADLTIEA
jgi:hypothetical protein